MRRTLLLVAVLLFLAPSASAHVLTVPGAQRVAERAAERVAAGNPAIRDSWVPGCRRLSNHVVHCRAWFYGRTVECRRTIRVRFPNSFNRHVRVSFPYPAVCF